jgi:UDP-N-acetylmuramoylalanine--D-glutamate ligase
LAKKITILGAGESGVGAAILAQQKGYAVWLSDGGSIKPHHKQTLTAHGIAFEEGQHSTDKILEATEVVKSPGIPNTAPIVQAIISKAIPIISEIELAYRYVGNSKVVAITGTNGKSTTTWLTYQYFKNAGYSCALVGNIGYSFAAQVAQEPKEWYIVEVSSFQLDDCHTFKPNIAILTNITPDHLDRYNNQIELYIASKFSITKNQTADDYFIYNIDDELTEKNISLYPFYSNPLIISMYRKITRGAFINKDQMLLYAGKENVEMSVNDFALKGKHNQYNTMAASVAASTAGIRKESIAQSIQSTTGLEHRMEHVAVIRGVTFINDSKATNVNSTWYALESMEKPTVLILGGVDKGNDYAVLDDLVEAKVKALICLGKDNKKIVQHFKTKVPQIAETNTMQACVKKAFEFAQKGYTVLFAPACASFDLFKNFEERGAAFKKEVMEL